MARLPILEFPDPRLRRVAKPIAAVTERERKLAADMLETMYDACGIGLAATQVNEHVRMLVLDLSDSRDQGKVFINPEILERSGAQSCEEGCLSVPGVKVEVPRAEHIRVRALGLDGESFELQADGLLSICIQHEIDHLDGKLFVDYLSPLKRRMIEKRLKKQKLRDAEAAT